ncbi:MAG: STAS/SEC14 domain-containing protein [Acidimicrobiia bacterium]|nr:STAS/SEC14 domain-containing protein [Acidimicrobiia bacterium]
MLELLPDLPDHVLGIKAIGDVEDDDYEDVLVPAIDDRLSRHEKIRLLYVLGEEFDGYEGDALWEDAKLGMKTFTSYDRIAIVTDSKLISRSVKAFGWLMPGEVKVYPIADVEGATGWITS